MIKFLLKFSNGYFSRQNRKYNLATPAYELIFRTEKLGCNHIQFFNKSNFIDITRK